MDTRPIGVFDSGLGGLTAVRELRHILPGEDVVYFGDTGRVPYGGRSRETIIKYARQDVAFLRTFDLKAIVVACGTVSATALDLLQAESPVPVLGVVSPGGLAAARATKNKKVGLIGTQASIRSGAYEKVISRADPSIQVFSEACPLFVPLVENGRFAAGDLVAETVCREYLAPIQAAGVDTLVLGCTHYPLLMPVITQVMGEDVTLIDTCRQCVLSLEQLLAQTGALAPTGRAGRRRYFISDTADGFSKLASLFLDEDVSGAVEQVDIDRF